MNSEFGQSGPGSQPLQNKVEDIPVLKHHLDKSLLPSEAKVTEALERFKAKKALFEAASSISQTVELPTEEQAQKALRHEVALLHEEAEPVIPNSPTKQERFEAKNPQKKGFLRRTLDKGVGILSSRLGRTVLAGSAAGVAGLAVTDSNIYKPAAIVREGKNPGQAAFEHGLRLGPKTAEASNPASNFDRVWNATDGGRIWGPEYAPVTSRPYKEAPGGQRLDRVYEKGIMEDNSYRAGPPWDVTSALIPKLLIEGKVQVGDNDFIQKGTPDTPIAGDDQNNPNCPTYKTLNDGGFMYKPSLSENQDIIQTLNKEGVVGQDERFNQYNVKGGTFIQETNHRVADVFDQFRYAYSTVPYKDVNYLTGFPITEAYWTTINLGEKPTDVLVQVFERRTLTYTPSNPAGWQVELGNIGRDYERFRDTGGASEIVNNDGDGWHWKYTKNFMGKSAPVGLEPIDKAALDQVGPIMRQYGYSGDVEVDIITGPEERPDLDSNYWNNMRLKDPSGNEIIIGSFWGNPGYKGPAIIYLNMSQLQQINDWNMVKINLINQAEVLKFGIDERSFPMQREINPILINNTKLVFN